MFRVLALLFVATSAFAGPVVPNGVRFYFSPRGQQYFRENLQSVLFANKIDLTKKHWDQIQFVLNDPFKIPNPELEELRAHFASYFFGFPINKPKFQITLKNSDLPVTFQAAGAEVDPAGPEAYGRHKGVIILMHLVAENARFVAPEVRLLDLANRDLLGVMGADQVSLNLMDGANRPLRVEIPIHVDTDAKGARMEILGVRTNLQKTAFDLSFEKLLLPTITVTVNGKDYSFDKAAFEQDVRGRLPHLAEVIGAALKSYFETSGKDLIQPAFNDLAKSLTINMDFGIPAKSGHPETDLGVTLHPVEAQYLPENKHLGLVFNAELTDKNESLRTMFPTPGRARDPGLNDVPADSYDVALVVHPAGLNAVIDRAWEHGILKEVEIGKDSDGDPEKVILPKPPIATLMGQRSADRASIHAWIGYRVKGLGKILFLHPLPIELDLRVKLETNAKNEIELVLEEIDESTLRVDTSATWFFPLRGKINSIVKEKIAKLNGDLKTKRTRLSSIPTLDKLIGIPLKLDKALGDGGNLVLFADFDVK